MVSWLNACENCTKAHAEMAQSLGVDRATSTIYGTTREATAFRLPSARRWPPRSRSRASRARCPAVREALEAHYDAGEIVEIVAAIGLTNYLSRASNVLSG